MKNSPKEYPKGSFFQMSKYLLLIHFGNLFAGISFSWRKKMTNKLPAATLIF